MSANMNVEKQVEKIKADAQRQIAELKAQGVRDALLTSAKNPKVGDKELYTVAKAFCNLQEKLARSKKTE